MSDQIIRRECPECGAVEPITWGADVGRVRHIDARGVQHPCYASLIERTYVLAPEFWRVERFEGNGIWQALVIRQSREEADEAARTLTERTGVKHNFTRIELDGVLGFANDLLFDGEAARTSPESETVSIDALLSDKAVEAAYEATDRMCPRSRVLPAIEAAIKAAKE